MTAWEHSLRVPLIIAAPWLPLTHGKLHTGMAEMCDFYRTLSDLAGIESSAVDPGVECEGLATVFSSPSASGKKYAFSQTQRIGIPDLRVEPMRCAHSCKNPYKHLPPVADSFFAPSCFSYNYQIQWMVRASFTCTLSCQRNGPCAQSFCHRCANSIRPVFVTEITGAMWVGLHSALS